MKKIMIVLLMLMAGPVWGHEFSALGGIIRDTDENKHAGAYQFEYAAAIGGPFVYSVSYLNEGHFVHGHRDGLILQLWGKAPAVFHPSLELKGGLGPYLYFNTNERFTGSYFKHEHGVGAAVSLGAEWHFRKPFFLEARGNWILSESDFDTLAFLVGLGLELDRMPDQDAGRELLDIRANKNEVTPFAGLMMSNNSDSGNAAAWGVEYRRAFGRYIDWTVAWIDEGDNDTFHRRGVASQIWAGDAFYGDRLHAGIGFGPYLAWNAYRDRLTGEEGHITAGLLSIQAAYRLNPTWAVRGAWNRVITDYDRDSDLFWIGPSFRF